MATRGNRANRALHRSIAAFGGLAVGVSSSALALSLGQPQTQSHLTEPLRLKLPISDTDGDPGEYRARLLPVSAYSALGYPPPEHALQDFAVSIDGEGSDRWVLIRTTRPVREPILSLLLEVRKPGTSLVRGIDLLLDPPPAGPAPKPTRAVAEPADVEPSQPASKQPVSLPALTAERIGAYYGPVRPGESLSRIAQRARPHPEIPIDHMAALLYALNRAAFDGSPHRLRTGVTLAVPTLDTIESQSASLAWYRQDAPTIKIAASGPSAPELDANPPAADTTRPARTAPEAQSRLYLQGQSLALELQFHSYQPVTLAASPSRPRNFQVDWSLGDTGPASPTAVEAAGAPRTATDLGWEAELAGAASDVKARPVSPAEDSVNAQVPAATPQSADADATFWLRWLVFLGLLGLAGLVVWLRRHTLLKPAAPKSPASFNASPAARSLPGFEPLDARPEAPEAPASQHAGQTEDGDPLVIALHRRLSTLLADEPNATTRRQARVALSSLEAGQFDRAELIVETLEALQAEEQPASASTPGKVVHLPGRKQAKG